jgi:hypothetical protein
VADEIVPFGARERAQPGRLSTGTWPMRAVSSMLPGSTGMPKCSMAPPAAAMAVGTMSARSLLMVAPRMSSRSQPAASAWAMDCRRACTSWAQRNSSASLLPRDSTRVRLAADAMSIWRSPVLGDTLGSGPCGGVGRAAKSVVAQHPARQSAMTWLATANGMTLTVAMRWSLATTVHGGSVAMVSVSLTRFKRVTQSPSTLSRPAARAYRLHRPV